MQNATGTVLRSRAALFGAVVAALLTGSPPAALAADWACANGLWSNAACWSPVAVPGAGDTVNISSVGAVTTVATVDNGATFAVLALTIDALIGTDVTLAVPNLSTLNSAGTVIVGAAGPGAAAIDITGGGVVAESSGSVGTVTVSGAGSQWQNSSTLFMGNLGTGTLNVSAGGVVNNTNSGLAALAGASGTATVTGAGSQWNHTSTISVGTSGIGMLDVTGGGLVTNTGGFVGHIIGGVGTVNVSDAGSQWQNTGDLSIGEAGIGTLNVSLGGVVSTQSGRIGNLAGSNGTVTVASALPGSDSIWDLSGNLAVGVAGTAALDVQTGGLVRVGDTTTIGAGGLLGLNGGRLEFGQMALADIALVNAVSGEIAGRTIHSGFTDVAGPTFDTLRFGPAVVSEIIVDYTGVIFGNGDVPATVDNTASGELQAAAGERLRVGGGVDSTNAGAVNVFGGEVRFERALSNTGEVNNFDGRLVTGAGLANQAGGFIGGRGQFLANGGISNAGVMAFSGTTDILGDVTNLAGGTIVTSGGATTTFFDDVVHNGAEIRTAASAQSVFFGAVSGASPYTGTGTVFFEGDLRPGNSPELVTVEGDMVMGSGLTTLIEIAGTTRGTQYDAFDVGQTLTLGGTLDVDYFGGFMAQAGDVFDLFLAETVLGNFGAVDLSGLGGALTWQLDVLADAIGTTDVVRLSAVPLPAPVWLMLGAIATAFTFGRRSAPKAESNGHPRNAREMVVVI